jgi:hypothetical protein
MLFDAAGDPTLLRQALAPPGDRATADPTTSTD